MTSYDEIITRLKAGTGADRELDGMIWCAITPNRRYIGMAVRGQVWGDFEPDGFNPRASINEGLVFERTDFTGTREDIQRHGGRVQNFLSSPACTASIDASLALVERVLQGWEYVLEGSKKPCCVLLHPDNEEGECVVCETAATLPRAILLALFTALKTQEQNP